VCEWVVYNTLLPRLCGYSLLLRCVFVCRRKSYTIAVANNDCDVKILQRHFERGFYADQLELLFSLCAMACCCCVAVAVASFVVVAAVVVVVVFVVLWRAWVSCARTRWRGRRVSRHVLALLHTVCVGVGG
jgi:hypothetical protein